MVLAACRGGGGLGTPYEGIAFEPAHLQFGAVAVGYSARLELQVRNTGTPRRTVALAVTPPFVVEASELVLEGGATEVVGVRFEPKNLGAVTGVIGGLDVPLSGDDVPPGCSMLSCDDGNPCTIDNCEDGVCRHGQLNCPGGESSSRAELPSSSGRRIPVACLLTRAFSQWGQARLTIASRSPAAWCNARHAGCNSLTRCFS